MFTLPTRIVAARRRRLLCRGRFRRINGFQLSYVSAIGTVIVMPNLSAAISTCGIHFARTPKALDPKPLNPKLLRASKGAAFGKFGLCDFSPEEEVWFLKVTQS